MAAEDAVLALLLCLLVQWSCPEEPYTSAGRLSTTCVEAGGSYGQSITVAVVAKLCNPLQAPTTPPSSSGEEDLVLE
jgi:hypothetical protein